jgi:hypothetical protein
MTMAIPLGAGSVENSGSLTGHILSQGWPDAPAPKNSNAKVMLIMTLVLGILVAIGVLVVLAAGDTFGTLFSGLING